MRSPLRTAYCVLLTGCCLLAAACGYHFAGTGGEAPGGIRSIAVEVLQNQTAEVGIESVFSNAILNEFIRTQRLAVRLRSEADAVLSGSISRITTQAVSHVEAEKTLETRVTVTLSLTLQRTGTGEILWQNQNLSYYQEYTETEEALARRRNRRQALADIAGFLAEKVYQNIFEGF